MTESEHPTSFPEIQRKDKGGVTNGTDPMLSQAAAEILVVCPR